MRKFILTPLIAILLSFGLTFNLTAQDLMITGVFDGPLTGGSPKVLELYAVNDIADLSVYTVKNQTNANTTWGADFTLSGSATAGDFIYIVNSGQTADFNTYFENTITPLESGVINLNGDDRVALFNDSDVMIDLFGEDGVDGTTTGWEWLDGWAYRNIGTSASATFTESEWTYSGINVTDGETLNSSAATPFPIGSFIKNLAELELAGNDITLTWNAPIGTYDAGIIINGAPYNTDGGFFLVQLLDESDNLVTFADVFDEFSIGNLHYHSGTSNRILADFTATQQSGIWGTAAVSDNATAGGSLRGTTLDGSLFYGVMVDGTVGTVGAVLPGTSSETSTIAYLANATATGVYTLKADFYVPFRPGTVGSAGFHTVAELEGLEPIASISKEIDLGTGCTPISTFPFTEGFEDVAMPDCWTVLNEDGDTKEWDIYTSDANTGSQCAAVGYNGSGNDDWLITPQISVNSDNLYVVFAAKSGSSSYLEDYNVLVSTSGTATTDFTTVLENVTSAPNSWETKSYKLSDFSINSGDDIYVAIQCISNNELRFQIDDFQLLEITCPASSDLTIDSYTSSEVTLSWTENGSATAWNIIYGAPGFDPETEGTTVTADAIPFTVNGLSANTDYDIYVQADCGSGDLSNWSNSISVTTECTAISSFPLVEDFEGTYPVDCWETVYANTSYPSGNAMSHSTSQAYEGTQSFRFSSYSDGSPYEQYLVTPELNMGSGSVVEFWYRKYSSGSESFTVGTSTSGSDVTTDFTWETNTTDASTTWQKYTLPLDAGVKYVAIQYNSDFSYYLYIDEFTIREMSNEKDFLSFSLTEQTGDATINADTHTIDIEVLYGTDLTALIANFTLSPYATVAIAGTEQESGVTGNNFSSPVIYTITAEDGTTQEWTVNVTAATTQSSENEILTFVLDEQTGDATIDAVNHTVGIEINWIADITSLTPTITISNFASISPESGIEQDFSSPLNYTVTAEDGTEQVWTVTVTQDAIPEGATCANALAYTNINDAEVTTTIDTLSRELWFTVVLDQPYVDIQVSTCPSVYDTKVYVYDGCEGTELASNDDAPSDFCSADNNQSLAEIDHLEAGTYYVLITPYGTTTDISDPTTGLLVTGSNCGTPVDITATDITSNSALISWTPLTSETAWNLKVSTSSIDPTSETGDIFDDIVNTTSEQALTELAAITDYYIYVQANCGSDWSSEEVFTTECGVYTAPYLEEFSSYLPDCWEEAAGALADPVSFTSTTSSSWGNDGFANDGSTGAARMNVYGTGADEWLITPEIDLGDGSTPLSLIFDLALTDYGNTNPIEDPLNGLDDRFAVIISTDGGTTWSSANTLAVWNNVGSSYVYNDIATSGENVILDLSAYSGVVKFGFYAESTEGNADNDLFIDNVEVRELNSEADILTFELVEQTTPATIDAGTLTVEIEVGAATNLTALTPTITVSDYASIVPESGVAQDFTNPVTYTVTAEDGTENLWEVTVTPAATLSSENDILTFELAEQTGPATIGAGTIDIEVGWQTDLSSLTPTITVSTLASISPESGVALDFTNPVTYTVTAEDESTQNWVVTVTNAAPPAGATCETAIPYTNINDPEVTTTINADSRELWFTVVLDQSYADIQVSTCPSVYDTKVYVYDACGGNQLAYDDDSPTDFCSVDNNQSLAEIESLSAGTYYVLITPYGTTTDISDPTTGLLVTGSDCGTPIDVTATDMTPTGALISWTPLTDETGWNLKVSTTSIDPTSEAGDIFDATVSTTPEQELSTLTAETDYYVYVQADCGSDWTSEYTFTTPSTCPQPTDLIFTPSTNLAEVAWTAYGETAWNIKVSTSSIDPTTTDGDILANEAISANPYTIMSLTSNTTYYVYIQSSCGSEWSDETSFTTECDAVATPYYQDFEEFTLQEGFNSGNCWFGIGSGANDIDVVNSTDFDMGSPHSGSVAIELNDGAYGSDLSAFITPELAGLALGDKRIRFYAIAENYTENELYIAFIDNSLEVSSLNIFDTISFDVDDTWEEYTIMLDNAAIIGSATRIAFVHGNSTYEIGLDDFIYEEIPSCFSVSDIAVDSYTSTEVTLSWIENGSATEWNIIYGAPGFDPETEGTTVAASTMPFTVESLTSDTQYDFYVQANCGVDDLSTLVGPVTATTAIACPVPTDIVVNSSTDMAEITWNAYGQTEWNIKVSTSSIDPTSANGDILANELISANPYTIMSLTSNTTYYVYIQSSCGSEWSDETIFTTDCEAFTSIPFTEDFESGVFPPECWTSNDFDGTGTQWESSSAQANSGSNSARHNFSSAAMQDGWLITPGIELPAGGDYIFEFWSYNTWASDYYKNSVLISTTGTSPADFTEIWTPTSVSASWTETSLNISSYAGETVYIAFRYEGNNADGWHVDDVTLREINTEADFLTYSFPEQTGAADINYTAYTIDVEVGNGTDLTTLVADYTVSTGASVSIGTTAQESGVSINDFSSPVTYSITAEDGVTVNDWVVTVNESAIFTETDFISYTFPEATNIATIDTDAKTVDIEVAWNADVTTLIADFTLSYGATAAITGTDQESGVTANDFTDPVVYTVTAEDGTTSTEWTVTVSVQSIPQGATCADPFNYGTINDPEVVTNIDPHGRELWYTFTIDQPFTDIQVSTCASVYDTKVYVYDACGGNELAYDDDAPDGFCDVNNNQSLAEIDFLEAGTYYVLITTYSTTTNISDPTTGLYISGTVDYTSPYVNNTTLTLTPETQNVATGDDATGVMEVVYPTTVSTEMPVDMMTDAMIDLSELTAGAVVELFNGATSLGTYTVTGGETVWASEAFTGVNRVAASLTAGQNLNWDVVISGLANGTYNVSATLYLGLDADLTAETDITEVATDAMEIIVAAPFIDLALISPEGGMYDCGLEDPVNVPVEIENIGNTTIATSEVITFYVDVNGTNELEEEITLTEDLLPGETLSMETTSTLDFTALGTYNWEAIIDYTGDADLNNNFTTGYLVHFNQDIEFVSAVNDTITVNATDWPYTIETNLTLSTDSVLVSTYEWELDGSTASTLTVDAEGWYVLHVTTEFCETMDSVFVLAYNSININAENEFAIYPNPTHGQFMLEMNLVERQDVVISIFNSNGQLVREFKFDDIDQFAREINMTDEAEGLYSIRINAGGKLYNRQVIIR